MIEASTSNSDPAELGKFGAAAHTFWDRSGPFRTLHDVDPARLGYIAARAPLAGARVADIGCGGGLLSEGLARLGAAVTAIDLAPEMIEVARLHAAGAGLAIDYRLCAIEQLAGQQPRGFDVVCCMEMIEHVPDPARLLLQLAALLRPGGALFISTISRTPKAFATAIVAAEYLLGLVERGTHEYARLLRPAELAAHARAAGLELCDVTGLGYNPLTRRARLGGQPDVNYLAQLRAPGAVHP
jgi:2-polyprenyl-6-hydroxyphenyl methylase/3-demethylubiquinone-9 3-methyltransferase